MMKFSLWNHIVDCFVELVIFIVKQFFKGYWSCFSTILAFFISFLKRDPAENDNNNRIR